MAATDDSNVFTRRNFVKGALATAAVAGMGVVGTACASNGGEAPDKGANAATGVDGVDYTNVYEGGAQSDARAQSRLPGPARSCGV